MKKGFTLIEVMVVIVILGVLAVVSIPKLFGMVAKAKASEVPIAAGSYTKLQDVFLAEKTAVGNWKSIGYVAPGNGRTDSFCYSQGSLTQDSIGTDGISEGIIGWGAQALVSLNECGASSWWSLVMTINGSNGVSYAQNVSYAPCSALTSNWEEGITLLGACESATVTSSKKDDSSASDSNGSEGGSNSNSCSNGNGNGAYHANCGSGQNENHGNGSNENGNKNGWEKGVGNPHKSN